MIDKGILSEIERERSTQDAKWGGGAHDDGHSVADWFNFIGEHAQPKAGRNDRKQLVRIAALAVAALESMDRLAARKPRPSPTRSRK